MSDTAIEYLDKAWNFYTGCKNDKSVCPCADKCWAKAIDKRFHRSFEPMLHPEKLLEPLKIKNPSRIGVCFTGDLFGDWVDPEKQIGERVQVQKLIEYKGWIAHPDASLKHVIYVVTRECPQHQFLFLTKCPQNYQKWGKFPDNAWLGTSVNYAAPMGMALTYLAETEAKHKWLSIEPLMGEIKIGNLQGVDWVVIGGWSRSKIQPEVKWIAKIVDACDKSDIPVFFKNNLITLLIKNDADWAFDCTRKLRQEIPKEQKPCPIN